MNSKEPAQALHGRELACPVRASSIIQPGKSHCRELAGPEDGRINYVSNVPVIYEDGTTAKVSIMYDITKRRRL
jgi:predicted nucleic acid-binding Zn finger protein